MQLYNDWKKKKAQQRNDSMRRSAANRSKAPAGPGRGKGSVLVPGDQSYYHGKINRDEAIRRLGLVNKNGAFLLRDGSEPGTYSISLQVDGNVNHIRITNKPGGKFAIGKSNDAYPTVFKCIEANAGAKLSNTMGQPNVKLSIPIPAPGKQVMKAPMVAAAAARGAAPKLGGGKPKGPHRFYKVKSAWSSGLTCFAHAMRLRRSRLSPRAVRKRVGGMATLLGIPSYDNSS